MPGKRARTQFVVKGASLASAYLLWATPGLSQIPVSWQRDNAAPAASAGTAGQRDEVESARPWREAWTLSLEGVTHAPLDMGVALGLQTPPGLRLSGGVGWVPGSYMGLLTGIAASASGNGYANVLLDKAEYEGRTWRVQVGLRPFRSLGLYADVGYARVNAEGSLALEDSGVATLEALGGSYRAETKLDMWLIELGYQGQLADRLVLSLGLGVMGTWSSNTTLVALDGARSDGRLLSRIEADTDAALERYGIMPTLTLRLGFDLI
jgi:hypothetical protein